MAPDEGKGLMRRLIVFLLGFLVALIALEVALRLLGLGYGLMEGGDRRPGVLSGRGSYVILCLGNSYTQGTGASAGMSYPEQLQRMFKGQMPKTRVRVINQGKGSQNTAELLAELPSNLDKFLPDLVILQTGQPNEWNYIGYEKHLKRESGSLSWRDGVEELLRWALYQSRAYRLLALVAGHVKAPDFLKRRLPSPDQSYFLDGEHQEANQYIMSATSPYGNSKREPLDRERVLRFRRVLLRATQKDPKNPVNYILLGNMAYLQNKHEEAIFWYIKSLEVDPALKRGNALHPGYQALREARQQDKGASNDRLNEHIDNFIEQFMGKYSEKARFLFLLKDLEILSWMKSDMEEILRILRGRKTRLLVQNYPVTMRANEVLMEVAGRNGIPFVDNKKAFEEKMAEGVKREDLFVPDGHCNDAGYGLMAENVYRKILAEKLLS
ncbi:MAG: GDSL-type esterase/lipase family protein [Candidatus Omnitrophota bacterium]